MRRRRRGQATVESVMVILILSLLLFFLIQIAYLYIGQMVVNHAAFVMGRSHVVGFDQRIVRRAMEVGTIPMAGRLVMPEAVSSLPIAEQREMEAMLIEEFIQSNHYLIFYEHWPRISASLPVSEREQVEAFRANVHNYPMEMPMVGAYMRRPQVSFRGRADLYNHSAYYLE